MEFHGTLGAPISMTRAVPWNSMEFHRTCANFDDKSSSMEFHGTLGAPISMTRAVSWNSMEFHGTARVIEIGAPKVPWNSMERHGT